MDVNVVNVGIPAQQEQFPLRLFYRHPKPQTRLFCEHRHVEFEIGYFKSGKGIYKTAAKDYSIQKGDIFLFRSNEAHWISKISAEEPMEIMNIHFEPHLIWNANQSLFVPDALRIFLNKQHTFCHRLDRQNPALEQIKYLLLNIEKEVSEKKREYSFMIRSSLLSILILLTRDFGYEYQGDDGSFSRDTTEAIENSMDYILNHLADDLTLAELAQVANLSKTYYSTVFTKLNGMSPWDYIVGKRIELSISYLHNGHDTMLSVALKSGFKSTANFNKAFKKFTGKTPSEYRNTRQLLID